MFRKLVIAGVAVPLSLGAIYLTGLWIANGFDPRFLSIDRCLDSGGKWDYDMKRCITSRDLRGHWSPSPDGKTYMVIDDDNGGNCGPIMIDDRRWEHPVHRAGPITPGSHTISCGPTMRPKYNNGIDFRVQVGVTYHFDYWGP